MNVPGFNTNRGNVTAFIACGGDGTVNIIGRSALANNIPLGILPMGRFNNIATSLCHKGERPSINLAIEKIIARNYRKIDTATVSGLPFFGSIGLGFTPRLTTVLEDKTPPRFGFTWSNLAGKVLNEITAHKKVIKVDAFRFEVKTLFFNINLLSHSAGLPVSPLSVDDDGLMEVIFDHTEKTRDLSSFIGALFKKKYIYGSDIRIYRGTNISLQTKRGQDLYLDGEIIEVPTNKLEIKIGEHQLKIFC